MPVIALVGNKGGAGKTTMSVNLSSCLARNKSIAVIDSDPQGSAHQWRIFSDDEDAMPVFHQTDNLDSHASKLLNDYEYVVIDCPPSVHAPQTTSVLGFSDVALIPVQPSPVDLWATIHIEEAVENARAKNPGLQALLVINQLEVRTTMSRVVREAVKEIGLPVAETALRRRAIYRSSALEGKSVFDMGKRGADAADELEQLMQEIIRL
jgi:chromosome partitioning protein